MSTLTPTELQYMESHVHDNKSPQIVISCIICLVAAYAAVLLRLHARHISKAGYGIDDLFILMAVASLTGYTIAASLTTRYGMGKHTLVVTNIYGLITTQFAAETLYNFTIPLIKISILFLFGRIFPQRRFKVLLASIGTFVAIYQVAQILACVFQCSPVHKLWNPQVPGNCVNFPDVLIVFGAINVFTEIVIIALPMPLLWRLKMPTSQKFMLSVVFLIGACVCIASIVRITYGKTLSSRDASYDVVPAIICSTVELSVGIVSACVPAFGPLTYRFIRGRVVRKPAGQSTYRNHLEREAFQMSSPPKGSSKGWSSLGEPRNQAEDAETLCQYGRAEWM